MRDVALDSRRPIAMDLLLLGVSHHDATLGSRERLAAAVGDVATFGARLRAAVPAVGELLVLSTCHRFEVYAAVSDAAAADAGLRAALSSGRDVPLVGRTGRAAIEHLCRVACGLESLVLGEAEISGQVRRAAVAAREAGLIGPYLEAVVAAALRASGRARAETTIGHGGMSAASAAVALAVAHFGSLADRRVLILGAGQTGRAALAGVARHQPADLVIASRSAHHARAAADACEAPVRVQPLEAAPELAAQADLVVAAMHAPAVVLSAEQVAALMRRRGGRAWTAIDLSVPRVIDPASGSMPDVRLFGVDDLGSIAKHAGDVRARAVPAVEAIACGEATRALVRIGARRAWADGRGRVGRPSVSR